MWPDCVVFPPIFLGKNSSFEDRVEDLSVEQFISQFPIEGLNVPILPWTSGLDVECLHAQSIQPAADDLCRELRSVVRSQMIRDTPC